MTTTSTENLIARITERHEADLASGQLAVHRTDIPISYEAITPQWMTAILCEGHTDAEVVAVSLGDPDDGSANRRRLFVEYNDAGREAGLPGTVFCKATHGLLNKITFGVIGAAHAEVAFYNSLRPQLKLETPRAYLAAYDPESFNSIIMLEDLADRVTFCSTKTEIDRAAAEELITTLAGFHAQFQGDGMAAVEPLALKTWPEWWDACASMGMQEYTNNGLLAASDVVPDRLLARREEVWPASMRSVEAHTSLPPGLIHSDVHLKNWYITRDGRLGLTDWQCINIGHWTRDLSYAISTTLSPENRRSWERDLITLYLNALKERSVSTPSFEETWTHYRQQLFGALAVWTVTLTPAPGMPDFQPRADTLEFIRRMTIAIDDLDALDSFSD